MSLWGKYCKSNTLCEHSKEFSKNVVCVNFPVKSMPQRYILVTMTFMVLVNIIALRSCLSLALTQMVPTITIDENAPADFDTCPVENVASTENGTEVTIQVGEYIHG